MTRDYVRAGQNLIRGLEGSRVLKPSTKLWVTAKDGTSQMTFAGLIRSIQGGTRLEEIESR